MSRSSTSSPLEEDTAIERAKEAWKRAEKGDDVLTMDAFLSGMARRADAARQRIRNATAEKGRRAAR